VVAPYNAANPGLPRAPVGSRHPAAQPYARLGLLRTAAADVRELLYTAVEREAHHIVGDRPGREGLHASLAIDQSLTANPKPTAALLDDTLTIGCGFKVYEEMVMAL